MKGESQSVVVAFIMRGKMFTRFLPKIVLKKLFSTFIKVYLIECNIYYLFINIIKDIK